MILNLHCYDHLGDNLFNLIFLHIIKDYLENNDITVNYYGPSEYMNQLSEFVSSKKIKLINKHEGHHSNLGLFLWIGNRDICSIFDYDHCNTDPNKISLPFNEFLVKFFNRTLQIINIPLTIEKYQYTDVDLLYRYDKMNCIYKEIDILIINSIAMSGQYSYDKNIWDTYITDLHNKYKIVTTLKVNKVNCTTDDKLTVKDIAAISTHAKIIIAINTGPLVGIFNSYTLNNVKAVYVFDIWHYYNYPKFIKKNEITEITSGELDNILNSFSKSVPSKEII